MAAVDDILINIAADIHFVFAVPQLDSAAIHRAFYAYPVVAIAKLYAGIKRAANFDAVIAVTKVDARTVGIALNE